MTKEETDLLFSQAKELYTLGMKIEMERNKLKRLVEQGVSYNAPEMLNTLECFKKVDAEWKGLEDEHLKLRDILGIT